jgi:hypothetical protein
MSIIALDGGARRMANAVNGESLGTSQIGNAPRWMKAWVTPLRLPRSGGTPLSMPHQILADTRHIMF